MGREEEGTSSNCREVLALRGIPVTTPMLYLCDNQAMLKAVKRCVSKDERVKSVGAPDEDISREAIGKLRKRQSGGAATFMVKTQSAS